MYMGLQFLSRMILATATLLVFCVSMNAISDDVVSKVVEFSASTIEKISSQEPILGKLYVAKDKVRIEMDIDGKRRIIIRDFSARKTLHLDLADKKYMEVSWPATKFNQLPSSVKRPPLPGDSDHVCAKLDRFKCSLLSEEEKINDRKTEKWEIVQVIQANNKQSDKTRTVRSLVWVDRELGVNVREEMFFDANSKSLRELRAIKEGLQPKALFQVPTDYRRVEMPGPRSHGDNMQPIK
uniref:Outer membrane lipoprotein-sorting protein n=1 Tax=Candidatus Kentrum sp. TUN TaxID=2126343 RepID=A0A450ZAG7_9GAMM|nr:MAG: Domain of unknown function (DUF4412) [Candidatus Kentron sp. TUN]VFK51993.1 MAG: Domain of unknown function (DUF4412) [Candidatus Kentron sp. TUN]